MKKLFSTIVCIALVMLAAVCHADIRPSEIALGGITVGASQNYVRSIYGNPNRTGYSRKGFTGPEWYYGKGFAVFFSDQANNTVHTVYVSANNGIHTPAGIHVGSKVSDMYRVYGKPDYESAYVSSTGFLKFQTKNGYITELSIFMDYM